jgi:hypothetical protein
MNIFRDMWSRVFSGKYPAMTAWDLKNTYRRVGKGEGEKKNKVCFKQLAIGMYV